MVNLEKFSVADLKKIYTEVGLQIQKTTEKPEKDGDETGYEPEQTVKRDEQEVNEFNGKTKKIEDTGKEAPEGQAEGSGKPGINAPTSAKLGVTKASVKKDYPQSAQMTKEPDPGEQMTEPSEANQMAQIMQMLQEILGKIGQAGGAPTPEMPPTDQIQHSEVPAPVTATPSTTGTDGKGVTINVTKRHVEDILKGMGYTPSGVSTPKPSVEVGHPLGNDSGIETNSLVSKFKIEKGMSPVVKNIGKMDWDECYNLSESMKPSHEGYF